MRSLHPLTAKALIVTGTLLLAGCRSWRPVALPQSAAPHTLRVTLHDGSVVSLDHARVEGDTLLVGEDPASEPVSVAVADIADVRAESFDAAKTLTLAGLGIPALVVALLALTYCDSCT